MQIFCLLNNKVFFDYPFVMIDKLFLRADDIELAVSRRLFFDRQQLVQETKYNGTVTKMLPLPIIHRWSCIFSPSIYCWAAPGRENHWVTEYFTTKNFTEASNQSGMVLSPAQCTIILHKESHLEVCIKITSGHFTLD